MAKKDEPESDDLILGRARAKAFREVYFDTLDAFVGRNLIPAEMAASISLELLAVAFHENFNKPDNLEVETVSSSTNSEMDTDDD